MRLRSVVVAVAIGSLAQFACGAARSPAPAPSSAPLSAAHADWTLLVYMAADDDLESAAFANLSEMAAVGSNDHVNVVVQIDRAAADHNGHGFRRAPLLNLPDFNSTKRLLVKQGGLTELADIGETNTGESATLGAFVTWGIKTFPAPKVALVIWDHGGATAGAAWDITNDQKALSIIDMRNGLASGLAGAGRAKVDILGFDACLMGNLGVTYELRELAEVIVASEEVEPAHGWPYTAVVSAMTSGMQTHDLARNIVESFEAECRAKKTIDLCTLTALDASKLSGIVASVDDLGFRLHRLMASSKDWITIARARSATEEYGASPGQESPYGTIDAVDFADKSGALLEDKANHVKVAVDAATIASMHGGGRPDAHGLSLTFPRQAEARLPDDASLAITSHLRWESFLKSFFEHEAGDSTAPDVSNVAVASSGGSFEVTGTVAGADDAGETYGVIALPAPGGGLAVLSLPLLSLPSGGVASFTWNGTLPAITDGESVAQTALYEEPQYGDDEASAIHILSMPAQLLPHGVEARAFDVVVYLKVSPDAHVSLHGVYKLTAGGPASEADLGEHDLLRPKTLALDANGVASWLPTKDGTALQHLDHLTLKELKAPAATYAVGLYVKDLAGNARAATAPLVTR